jgi:hypothetical protein
MHPNPTRDNPEPIVGWLAIAAHLRVEKTTAQRWERYNGLPVHRLPGKRGGVYARAEELNAWRSTNEREHAAAAPAADTPGAGASAADTPETGASDADTPGAGASDAGAPGADTSGADTPETGASDADTPGAGASAADTPEAPTSAADTSGADTSAEDAPAAAPHNGAWLDEGGAQPRRAGISDGVLTLRLPLRWKRWAAAAALVAALVWVAIAWFRPTAPAAFRMEGASLVAMNASGRELWRHAFPVALRPEDTQLGRNAWMGELTKGEPFRVFFPLGPAEGGTHAELYCLDPRGRQEWEFTPPAGFEIEAFRVFAAGQRELSRIVVSSADPWESANQVATVDGNGRLTGQYWHAGLLGYVVDANLDRDDPVDVLLSGVDEVHRQATVVGFDHRRLDRRAMPKLVVLFPRSCVAETLGPYNRACQMVWRGGVLRVMVREGPSPNSPPLIYEFDQGLKPLSVALSGEYLERRRELEIEGRLNHSCEGEADRLIGAVRVTWRGTLGE